MSNSTRIFATTFIAAFLVSSCQVSPPDNATWSGTVSIGAGRTIPFRMALDFSTDPPTGAFLVADERTPIPEITVYGDSLILSISEYRAALRGVWDGNRVTGYYERYRADTSRLPFSASPTDGHAPEGVTSRPGIRLSGNFRVYRNARERMDSSSTARFWVKGDSVFGTIIEPSGDFGLMAGTQSGSTVVLNRFTGWQVNQLELHWLGGDWEALYYVRSLDPTPMMLRPLAPDASIGPDERNTRMKNPDEPFAFWGLTPDGDTLRHTDDRFSGKVLLVDIMGTWCHNCLDAAPVLQQLYQDYQARGLEVVGLSFEISDDPALARKNLSLYQKRHGITFPLVFCGSLDPSNVQRRIRSQLEGFGAYPSTLFVGRDGRVRSIHTGFTGPGAGDLYQATVSAYVREVETLLKENED